MKNSSFSESNRVHQLAWDSTSLGLLMECPRKYHYSIVLGWQPRAQNVHLAFGIFYHSALELYDRARASGANHDNAQASAVFWTLTATWDRKLKRPWFSEDPNKNRLTLVRTIVWYLEQFKDDPIKTATRDGWAAVELSFRFQLNFTSSLTREPYTLCGHLDRIGELNDQAWIVDRKTTKNYLDERYFRQYSPDLQMSTYDFAGKVIYNIPVKGVIVDAAQILVGSSRFQRQEVPRSDSQREEFYHVLRYYIRQAESFAELNSWPPNWKACGNWGGCQFRDICGKGPEVREKWLQAMFVKRVWDPLRVRGDV